MKFLPLKDPIPDVVRDRWAHAALNVDLRHWETVIRESLHQGSIELEQIPATVTIHGQGYPREREYPQETHSCGNH